MDEKLQKYYDYLKAQGAYVPDTYESFRQGLSTDEGAKKYHDYALQNGYYAPQNYDEFAKSLGVGSYSSSTFSPTASINKNMGALDNNRPQQVQQAQPTNQNVPIANISNAPQPVNEYQPTGILNRSLPSIKENIPTADSLKYNLSSEDVFKNLNEIYNPENKLAEGSPSPQMASLAESGLGYNKEESDQKSIQAEQNLTLAGYDPKELHENFGSLSPEVKAQINVNDLMWMKEKILFNIDQQLRGYKYRMIL